MKNTFAQFLNKTITVKLNSGEEFIAKVAEVPEEGTFIKVDTPVSIGGGQKGLQLIPSMFTADPDSLVTINTTCVAMVTITEDSIRMKYVEATTGIQLPEKKIILG